MPRLFDPYRTQWSFLSEEAPGLARSLAERETEGKPIGNYAIFDLHDVVRAWLVGLEDEIDSVVARSIDWLNRAIAIDERFGQSLPFHRSELRSARAIALWLDRAQHVPDDWRIAYEERLAYWQAQPDMRSLRQEAVQMCFEDCMAFSVQAGGYDEAIALYERWGGVRKLGLGKLLRPREFAYAVSLHQARGQYDEAELFDAGRRMLQAHLERDWLGDGHAVQAAMWLKIVYWDRDLRAGRAPSLTPLQTVLKAYENMPNVVMPEFIEQP